MKKTIIFAVLAAAVGLGWHNWDRIKNFAFIALPEVRDSISLSGIVNDLARDVSMPGPLKGAINVPGSRLTVAGVAEWTNRQRASSSLPALKPNEVLNRAAQKKVDDMFAQQYFEHVSPDGKGPSDLVESVEYAYVAVGENLALGNYRNDQAVVQAWMDSPGHRANILSEKFTEIGVAVGRGTYEGSTVWLAVQTFARPASDCPAVDANVKAQIAGLKLEIEKLEQQLHSLKAALENSDPKSKEEYQVHNDKVREYNALVKIYNNKLDTVRSLVAQYNSQVNAFNACVGK